jgi:uncharacterized protein (DUF111 family)
MARVQVAGEEIRIKIAALEGREINVHPEFEDCRRAAQKSGMSLKEIIRLALQDHKNRRRK